MESVADSQAERATGDSGEKKNPADEKTSSRARQRLSGEQACGPARWSARWNGFRGSTCDVDMSSPPAVEAAKNEEKRNEKASIGLDAEASDIRTLADRRGCRADEGVRCVDVDPAGTASSHPYR